MIQKRLTFGNESFGEIKEYLENNFHYVQPNRYSLAIYDVLEETTIEVTCDKKDFLDVIGYVTNVEHSFPEWIGCDTFSESFVVGLKFAMGRLKAPMIAKWENGKLIESELH